MSIPVPYAAQLEFHGGRHITRRRPLIQVAAGHPAAGSDHARVLFDGEYPEGIRGFLGVIVALAGIGTAFTLGWAL
jgi:hypothetical protein